MANFFRVTCALATMCLIGTGIPAVVYAEEEVVPAAAVGVNRDILEKEVKLKEKVFAKFGTELRSLKKNCTEANDVETGEKLRAMISLKQFPKENTMATPFDFFQGEWLERTEKGGASVLRFDGRLAKCASEKTPSQWIDCGRVVSSDSLPEKVVLEGKLLRVWLKWNDDEIMQITADGKLSRLTRSAEWQSPSRQFSLLVKKMRGLYRKGKQRLRVSQIADLKKKQEAWKKDHQYAAAVWAEKKIQAFSAYVSASEKIAPTEESSNDDGELLDEVQLVGTWSFPEGKLIVQDVSTLRFADQKGKCARLVQTESPSGAFRLYQVKESKTKLFGEQTVYVAIPIGEKLYIAPTAKNVAIAFVGVREDSDDLFFDELNEETDGVSDDAIRSAAKIKGLEDEFGEP